jgi:hypothetical protein
MTKNLLYISRSSFYGGVKDKTAPAAGRTRIFSSIVQGHQHTDTAAASTNGIFSFAASTISSLSKLISLLHIKI